MANDDCFNIRGKWQVPSDHAPFSRHGGIAAVRRRELNEISYARRPLPIAGSRCRLYFNHESHELHELHELQEVQQYMKHKNYMKYKTHASVYSESCDSWFTWHFQGFWG
jgi:hypothetical protein